MSAEDHPVFGNRLAIRFSDENVEPFSGFSVMQFGVYDPETGELIGLTIKVGDEPVMMIPVVPIPNGAIRFDGEDRHHRGD
jgi:hypothetical protein